MNDELFRIPFVSPEELTELLTEYLQLGHEICETNFICEKCNLSCWSDSMWIILPRIRKLTCDEYLIKNLLE